MNIQSKNSIEKKKKILKNRAEILSRSLETQDQKTNLIEIIPFKLGQENFSLETKYIKEVYPLKEYTFLPCAPAFLYGLTNVRRRIVPIIDLKVLFSLSNDENIKKKLLIMENEDVEIALLIDGFSEIRTLSKDELQTTLPTLIGVRQDFLKGLIVDGTVILDGQKLLSSSYLAIDASIERV